jgi:hypothetical protein
MQGKLTPCMQSYSLCQVNYKIVISMFKTRNLISIFPIEHITLTIDCYHADPFRPYAEPKITSSKT